VLLEIKVIDVLKTNFSELSEIMHLSKGGQKEVYSAQHPYDGDVVIKIIHISTNRERIIREINAVKQIHSSRVPKILGVGVFPGGDQLWIREQRILGEDVKTILERGRLVEQEVLRLGLHVLETLSDAASVRIVHRDVKPANIIRSHDGSYWLIDFGIARHLDLFSLTGTELPQGPGTLGYAPREQFRNMKTDIDGRADLFALAVTLVECLTGIHPFRDGARDGGEVLRRIERQSLPVPPLSWDKQNGFKELVETMGQRMMDHRPRNAGEAFEWMKEICADNGLL
jgi:serine/threonine protein kinase